MMKLNLPEEVQLTMMLRRMENVNDVEKYPVDVEMKVRTRIAEIIGVELVSAQEIDEADEGFWTGCEGCRYDLVYLMGVAEFDICRACHYENKCLKFPYACGGDGVCEVYP